MTAKVPTKTIAEILGMLAVFAGLVFVGYELRQNNRLGRATAYQAIGTSTAETWATISTEPRLAELFLTGRDSAQVLQWTREDWATYAAGMQAFFRLLEMTLLQVEQGVLPPDAMDRLGYLSATDWLTSPSIACVWRRFGHMGTERFARFLQQRVDDPTAACPLQIPMEQLEPQTDAIQH